MPKPLTVWITTNWKILQGRNTRSPDLPLEKNLFLQVRRQQLELDVEQQTGPKSGKEYVKAVYCHPAYLTYLQSTSWEMLGWMKHKLESELPGEISITTDMQMTPPLGQKAKKNWVKEESKKVGLKLNIQKTKIMVSGPITWWQGDRETVETVTDFIFFGLQNHFGW